MGLKMLVWMNWKKNQYCMVTFQEHQTADSPYKCSSGCNWDGVRQEEWTLEG
jgi:hypothetical protein